MICRKRTKQNYSNVHQDTKENHPISSRQCSSSLKQVLEENQKQIESNKTIDTKPINLKEDKDSTSKLQSMFVKTKKYCPNFGIYFVPSIEDVEIWEGKIFIRKGYFKNAVLSFEMNFSQQSLTIVNKQSIPQVTFKNSLYHALVQASTRNVDMKTLLLEAPARLFEKDPLYCLTKRLNQMFYCRQLLSIRESYNKEAGKLYSLKEHLFAEKAFELVEQTNLSENSDKSNGMLSFRAFPGQIGSIQQRLSQICSETESVTLEAKKEKFLQSILRETQTFTEI